MMRDTIKKLKKIGLAIALISLLNPRLKLEGEANSEYIKKNGIVKTKNENS